MSCLYNHLFVSKQLEKQRRTDQELKKRVLKLEFCLQEARSQTRKLQRVNLAIYLFFILSFKRGIV